VTDFRTSTTLALPPTSTHRIHEIDTPLIPSTQVIERLGTHPTITVAMAVGDEPDVDGIWRYLKEPADFFGMPTPDPEGLRAALVRFAAIVASGRDRALVAATVTLLEIDGQPDFLVSGSVVQPVRATAVRIAVSDAAAPVHRVTDPVWLRMAARTTSRGAIDQIQRWCDDGGYADGVPTATSAGAPMLGALVFDTASGLVGIENPEPTSVLDQLMQCGVVNGVRRVDERPEHADRAWWISPTFETHPVASIGETCHRVDAAPPFVEWR
jgi:hypothetical protein